MFEKGEMIIKQNFDMFNSQLRSQFKLYGRNVEIFNIFNFLSENNQNNQFVVIYGDRGSGLTAISKKVARHLKERELVNEIIILDFEHSDKGISKFKNNLKKFKNGYRENNQSQQTLMILENCDDLILKHKDDFTKQLSDMNQRVKFIITAHFKPDLKFNESGVFFVELKSIPKEIAISIIQHHIGVKFKMMEQKYFGELQQILDKQPLNPKFIMEIVHNIKSDSKLSDLLISQDPLDNLFKQFHFLFFFNFITQHLLLRKIKNQKSKYEMLLVICLFPHGVSIEDLRQLALNNKISQDWENLMLDLTSNENVDSNLNQIIDELNSSSSSDSLDSSIFMSNGYDNSQNNRHHHHHQSHFKIGQYFWMNVSLNELQMIQFKIKKNIPKWLFSKNDYQMDLLKKEVIVLEFLSLYAKKILSCIKINSYQKLKMVDYSSIVDFGLFSINFTQDRLQDNDICESPTTPTLKKDYQEKFEEAVFKKYRKNIENLFNLQEQNMEFYLQKEDLMCIIEFVYQSNSNEKLLLRSVLRDLCQDLPSIHKLLNHKKDAVEQCDKAINILDELIKYPDNVSFLLSKIKILFIKANIYFDLVDQQAKIPDGFSNLIKSLKNIIEAIEVLEKDQEFQKQKNIIKLIQAEKIFMIGYAIKIKIDQKMSKYLEANNDLSKILDLFNLIDSNNKEQKPSNIQEICKYLIQYLDQQTSLLLEINGDNIIIEQNESNIFKNLLYYDSEERSNKSLEVLIQKIQFLSASIKGVQHWEDINEEYIETIQENIKTFSNYQLTELKEQGVKQFAKLFLKNIFISKQQQGETVSNQSRMELEIVRLVKNGSDDSNEDKTMKEIFEEAYNELQQQEQKDQQITLEQNA